MYILVDSPFFGAFLEEEEKFGSDVYWLKLLLMFYFFHSFQPHNNVISPVYITSNFVSNSIRSAIFLFLAPTSSPQSFINYLFIILK